MNILGRFTVRWLVGLVAVLTLLSHVSDAGRTARLGPPQGVAVASSAGEIHPGLVGEAPSGEIRFRAHDRQPLLPESSSDAVLPAVGPVPGATRLALLDSGPARTGTRQRAHAPGQRAPPLPAKA